MKFRSLLAAALLAVAHASAAPHIVFLLADDLGWSDVGWHGGDIATPNIDRLAASGAKLEQFYVQPVCSPTRAALMTGRYPMRYGLQVSVIRPWAQYGLPLEERTLPQALKSAGYATAIVGKWHLGHFERAYLPTQRGFDRQYGHYNGALDYFTHERDGGLDWHRDDRALREEGYATTLLGDEAVRLISAHDPATPLFLYVPFNAPHSPLQAPESYVERYRHIADSKRRAYAAMVHCLDDQVGRITAALDQRGMEKDTLIIFSSDNGGPAPGRVTMNTPLRAGKGTIYEGGMRVCAFATWPGHIPAGTTNKEPMHAVDWYPTLVKLAGAPASQKLAPDGLDLWPTLTQGAKSPHDAILLMGTTPGRAAVRMGDWKLLLNASETNAVEAATADEKPVKENGVELYNLADDISESKNLAGAQPQKVKELRARLDSFLKNAVPPGHPAAARAAARKNAPAK